MNGCWLFSGRLHRSAASRARATAARALLAACRRARGRTRPTGRRPRCSCVRHTRHAYSGARGASVVRFHLDIYFEVFHPTDCNDTQSPRRAVPFFAGWLAPAAVAVATAAPARGVAPPHGARARALACVMMMVDGVVTRPGDGGARRRWHRAAAAAAGAACDGAAGRQRAGHRLSGARAGTPHPAASPATAVAVVAATPPPPPSPPLPRPTRAAAIPAAATTPHAHARAAAASPPTPRAPCAAAASTQGRRLR